jgi:transketolase
MKLAFPLEDKVEKKMGVPAIIIFPHTIKPLDVEEVASTLRNHDQVVVLEEHVPHGGLGSSVKEIAGDTQASCDLPIFSLKDEFINCYESHQDLLKRHGFICSISSEKLGLA